MLSLGRYHSLRESRQSVCSFQSVSFVVPASVTDDHYTRQCQRALSSRDESSRITILEEKLVSVRLKSQPCLCLLDAFNQTRREH